jgi:hypothetical protein
VRTTAAIAACLAITALATLATPATADPAAAGAAPAAAPCLTLPPVVRPTLPPGNAVGATPERLATSKVPGPVADTEVVRVGVDAAGVPASVSVDQTLMLSGSGDYVIYERGPARSVIPLAQTAPPTLKLGRVTWEGYVPHAETLAASLGLDPVIEASRLPLQLTVTGTSVTFTNQTVLPGGEIDVAPVPAAELAGPLDLLDDQAKAHVTRPAVAGDGLPTSVGCDGGHPTGTIAITTFAPLRITGSLGAATPPVDGVLGALPATFAVTSFAPSLTVAPTLDPRTLVPPAGFATWAAWAASNPDAAARTAASATLETAAAAAARIREIEPYLAADLPGSATTSFHYALQPKPVVAAAIARVRPRPLPIALAALTGLLLLGTAAGLARRL